MVIQDSDITVVKTQQCSPDTARKTCREDGWFTHNGTLEEWTDFSGCDKTDDIVQMEYIR